MGDNEAMQGGDGLLKEAGDRGGGGRLFGIYGALVRRICWLNGTMLW